MRGRLEEIKKKMKDSEQRQERWNTLIRPVILIGIGVVVLILLYLYIRKVREVEKHRLKNTHTIHAALLQAI